MALAFSQSATEPARSVPLASQFKAVDLALPSFSIFGLSPDRGQKEIEKPYTPKELESFLAEVEKQSSNSGGTNNPSVKKREKPYWIIPFVLYRSKHLFAKDAWTDDEIKEGQKISSFFARLVKRPDLQIEAVEQQSFREGLLELKTWFVTLCQDNKMLASMIFTLDDGPFYGQSVRKSQIVKMKKVASVQIPGKQFKLVLMKEQKATEPVVIGLLNQNNSFVWAKRYSGKPVGTITSATLSKGGVEKLEGYGYKCGLIADWTYGSEYSHLYLDEQLNLRFYFVSW
jgi:hypothetical protein